MEQAPAESLAPVAAADALPLSALEHALEAARGRRQATREQIERLERDLALSEQEERLISELIAVRRGESRAGPGSRPPNTGTSQNSGLGPARDEPTKSSHPVVDEVLSMLVREKRPIHISEIMRMLRQRQIRLPGSGTQANVISHLRRDPRISRPSRGLYALSVWGLEDEEPRVVVRRRRRRRKTISRVSK